MKSLVLKWRLLRLEKDLIQVKVFYGEEGRTMQNAGTLVLRIGEYQLTAAALGMGAEKTQGHLRFETEGEEEALR